MAILLNLDIVNNAILPGPLLALPIGARLDISGFGPYEVNMSPLYPTRFRISFMALFLFLLISRRLSLLWHESASFFSRAAVRIDRFFLRYIGFRVTTVNLFWHFRTVYRSLQACQKMTIRTASLV